MGYIRHHAVIISTWEVERVRGFIDAATKLVGGDRFRHVGPVTNSYYTFFLAPDGSKEGWEESELGDIQRKKFIEIALECFKWPDIIEVEFGGDGFGEPDVINNFGTRDDSRGNLY